MKKAKIFMQKICSKIDKNVLAMLICGLLGMLVFIVVYGIDKLDFTNDKWLLYGGDLEQHYLGWKFFRKSNWTFPIGNMENIIYPYCASIVYTDSIPIFAIIFKTLSPILPSTFQYFGLYGVICYILQGIFSYLLIHRFCKDKKICIVGSMYFIVSTAMLQRMFVHTALASHFIILMAMLLWVYNKKIRVTPWKNMLLWIGVSTLATVIHLYFVPMVYLFMIVTFLINGIQDKKTIIYSIFTIITSILVNYIFLYLLGAFSAQSMSFATGGLGLYNSNLNTLFNSKMVEFSILPALENFSGQYEGYGYLGLGIILLLLITIIKFFTIKGKKKIIKNEYFLTGILMIVISIIISTGFSFTFNEVKMFTITLIKPINELFEIFRATGRFIWIAYYIIFLMSIVGTYKLMNSNRNGKIIVYILLIVCLTVQIFDIKGYATSIHKSKQNYKNIVQDTSINEELKNVFSNYEHISVLPIQYTMKNLSAIYYVAELAIDANCTINTFYLARSYNETYFYNEQQINDMMQGNARKDTLYVIISQKYIDDLKSKDTKMNFYKVADITFCTADEITMLDKYKIR